MGVLAASGMVALGLLLRWRRSGMTLGNFLGIGLVSLYTRLWHRYTANGPAPLPLKGPAILIANHTCSTDAAFLTSGCSRASQLPYRAGIL